MAKGVLAALVLLMAAQLSGCVGGPVALGPKRFLAERGLHESPTPEAFDYCWDHSCNRVVRLGLDPAAWSEVAAPLKPWPKSKADERKHLRKAVAAFEKRVAPLAGTIHDRGGTMTAYGAGGQLDCVDETANTTALLVMLEAEGLLRWHRPATPAGRGNLLDGLMPHRTASIVESGSGKEFAVDSWFHDNGAEPEVVAMSVWLSGWTPDDGIAVATEDDPSSDQPHQSLTAAAD